MIHFNLLRHSWVHCCPYSLTKTSPTVHFELDLSPIDVVKNLPLMSVWPGGVGMCRNLINCGWLFYLLCFVRCLVGIFCTLASFQFHWGMLQVLMENNCCVWLYFVKRPKAFTYKHPIKMHSLFLLLLIMPLDQEQSRLYIWPWLTSATQVGWFLSICLQCQEVVVSPLLNLSFVAEYSWLRSLDKKDHCNCLYIIGVQVIWRLLSNPRS